MLVRLLKTLKRCTRGNTSMLIGLSLVPMIGGIGLGVDAAQWVLWKRQLHSAADLAALAGARALAKNQPVGVAARRSLAYNNLRAFTVDAVESAPTVGKFAGSDKHVRVVLSTSEPLPFTGLFMAQPPSIKVEAVAENASTVPNCVIALDNSGTALNITGSAVVDMNCGMASNSDLDATSSGMIKAGALSAVGLVDPSGNVTADTKINNGIGVVADPYAGKLPKPDLSAMCAGAQYISVRSLQSQIIPPGCYTGMKSLGGLYLQDGTYYINGGDVIVGAQSLINCNSCTLVFTNADPASTAIGRFSAAGSSYVQMKAQTSGPYAGILMYQDERATPSKNTNFFVTGNTGNGIVSYLQGAIYTPKTYTDFIGNSNFQTNCMQLVAMQVTFTGNTTVSNQCPAGSGASSYGGGGTVRLVR